MTTKLDFEQVIKNVYDEESDSLKVTAGGSVTGQGVVQTNDIADPIGVKYDYFTKTVTTTNVADDTEVYTFKLGGSGGVTVRVATLVYSDGTRDSLLSGSFA